MPRSPVARPHPMLVALTILGVFLLVLWLAQRSLIYFPDSDLPAPADVGLPRADVVRLTTEDGLDLEGWLVPAQEPAANRLIVVFNGNAGHRGYRARLAAEFAALGYATLLADYRGFGGNPGLPSERGLARDARAVWRFIESRPDIDRSRVVYFGESLGAAVAIGLAVDHSPAALILRSPFTSLAAIGARHYPWLPVRTFLKDRYPSIERIDRVTCPILMVAGDADTIVPFEDTQALFAAAREPKRLVVIENADHNDEALAVGPRLIQAVAEFLR